MWVRGAAIRPVPPYAVVARDVLERIEEELASGAEQKPDLDEAFRRFETTQPALSQRAAQVLADPLDETALALGYFLTIAVWLGFERAFGARLEEVTEDALAAAETSIVLEEELRATHVGEPLELEDVIGIEQPGVIGFVNDHVEAALEPNEREPRDVDVDDVHKVYRNVLLLTVALSHAVAPASGSRTREMLA